MPGKHDSENQDPPFLSMLTNNANKRLSFIDKGKSWARQLLKNSNKGLNASQHSFESCDSGIDANSFVRGSFNSKTNTNKMPQSSSCSFIKSPYLSSSSSTNSSNYNSPITDSILTTSKSTSFTSEMSNSSFDQVYSSPSNSSSSSGYLISPIDESGYLVPIVTLSNRQSSFNEKHKPILGNPKARNKNRLSNLIPSCSPLTRSFSTRSAYTNQTKLSSSYSQYNPSNRATICEQMNVPESTNCIKCNCKLNNLKAINSENSTLKNLNDTKRNVQDLNKYNQDYNFFESHTCSSCISSTSDFNSPSSYKSCKPPIVPAPLPPVDKPPQLPQSHPPRCTSTLTNKTSIPSNPPPPLPLLPPPTRQHSFNSNFQNSIYLLTNSTSEPSTNQQPRDAIKIIPLLLCSDNNSAKSAETLNSQSIENLESFSNLFKEPLNKEEKEQQTPESHKTIVKRRKAGGNEIVYIDSADLESSFGGASSSSVSLSSSAGSLNRSTLSNPNFDMNHLIAKLRQNQISQYSNRSTKAANNDYNKLSYRQQQTNNRAAQQHDYHVIDEIINETVKRPPLRQQQGQQRQRRLTPNNSLASFDFIDPNYARLIKLDTTINSYEKSWEKNSTVILLDRLNEKLASSLIAIANEQKKQMESQADAAGRNCSMRERINDSQQQNNISFPFQRASLQKSLSQTLNSSSSGSGHHSFSSSHQSPTSSSQPLSNSNTIDSTTSGSSNELNSNSEDVEHLLTVSTTNNNTEDDASNLNKSYTNSSNSAYQYSYTSEFDRMDSLVESWYQPNLPRERVQECLADQEIGSFIIRLSNTCKNCYALSIRVPYFANQNGIAHYLITKNSRGFKLKGVEKEFKTLRSLVTHYSVMQEILPVTLNSLGLSMTNSNSDIDNQQRTNLHEYSDQNNNMSCIY